MSSLKAVEKNQLKEIITNQISELEKEIESLKENIKPISPDNAIGRLTRMEAINEKSVKEANLRNAEARIIKLQESLGKIDDPDSDYGICLECDEPIPFARLKAIPESTICVKCLQEQEEE